MDIINDWQSRYSASRSYTKSSRITILTEVDNAESSIIIELPKNALIPTEIQ